jgi:hypothetical protein
MYGQFDAEGKPMGLLARATKVAAPVTGEQRAQEIASAVDAFAELL